MQGSRRDAFGRTLGLAAGMLSGLAVTGCVSGRHNGTTSEHLSVAPSTREARSPAFTFHDQSPLEAEMRPPRTTPPARGLNPAASAQGNAN